MSKNIRESPARSGNQVVNINSALKHQDARTRSLLQAVESEPYRTLRLAQQAHDANHLEQAKILIEAVYALYDQDSPGANDIEPDGRQAIRPGR